MWPTAPFFPEQASELARSVDRLFFFALLVLVTFSTLITVLLLGFAVKYRRTAPDQTGVDVYHRNPSSSILALGFRW